MKEGARKGKRRKRRTGKNWKALLQERGVRKALWMLRIPTSFSELKGLIAEEIALRGFERLQQRRVEFYTIGAILNVTPTIHYSEEDKQAIDIKVEFQSETVLVEVKCHRWTAWEAYKWLKMDRCFVGLPLGSSNEEAVASVEEQLTWFLREREKMRSANAQLIGACR